MASKTCQVCLRALRRNSRPVTQANFPVRINRTFRTSSLCSMQLPGPNATATTSLSPVTPQAPLRNANSVRKSPPVDGVAEKIMRVTGRATETYTIYGVTEELFKICASKASYSIPQASDPGAEMPKTEDGEDLGVGSGWWHTELGLKPTFSTWSQVTMLHMYMLTTRIRCLPSTFAPQTYQQHLLDHFFYDAENRMTTEHNMHARGTRNRYLKDLFIQWRGLLAAYDEGLMKGDAVLASAVLRNVFKGDEEVDLQKVAIVVSYLRQSLRALESVVDETFQRGEVVFENPDNEMALVRKRSQLLSLPFKDRSVINKPSKG